MKIENGLAVKYKFRIRILFKANYNILTYPAIVATLLGRLTLAR